MLSRLALVLTAGLSFAACAIVESTPPMAGQRGALKKTDTLVYLGVDFTHARFSDSNFKYDDLVHAKILSWSRHALDVDAAKFPVTVTADLALKETRNAEVGPGSVVDWPTTLVGNTVDAERARAEVQPYVDLSKPGRALLIVADEVVKDSGFSAYYFIFDRSTGARLLLDRAITKPYGFGVHNYYLNGVKAVAKQAIATINWSVEAAGVGEGAGG